MNDHLISPNKLLC